MAQTITAINTATDTFNTWVTQTNTMIDYFGTEVMTANNNANGGFVTGNSQLFGIFTANTVAVYNTLRGGNVQSSGDLTVGSNMTCSGGWVNVTAGDLSVNRTGDTAAALLTMHADAAQLGDIYLSTGATNRWIIRKNATAEGGSDAGSDFELRRHNDAGTYQDSPITITRSTGDIAIANNMTFTNEAAALYISDSATNTVITETDITLANSTVSFAITKPTAGEVSAGNYFLGANGTWQSAGAGSVGTSGSPLSTHIATFTDPTTITGAADFTFDGADLIFYNAVNDGNPEVRMGATDAEEFHMQAVFDTGAQTLDYVLFQTDVASATADKGLFRFNVDGTNILDIDDGGLEITGGLTTTANISTTGSILLTDEAEAIRVSDSATNTVITETEITLANSTVSFAVSKPTAAEVSSGDYFLGANGTWQQAGGGATLNANNTHDSTYYVGLSSASTGSWTNAVVSTTKLYFNPSSGELSATDFNSLSDLALKQDINPIEDALNKVKEISGVQFKWKENNQSSAGFIAQEVQKILPEIVSENNTVKFVGLIGLLIEAVKELDNKLEGVLHGQGRK